MPSKHPINTGEDALDGFNHATSRKALNKACSRFEAESEEQPSIGRHSSKAQENDAPQESD